MERIGQRELYAKGGITKWYWDLRDRFVLRHTKYAHRVLDVGCGEGITLEKVRKQCDRRVMNGIDVETSDAFIAYRNGLAVCPMSVYDLKPQKYWDCCLLLDVLEHLDYPVEALVRVYDVLASNGNLVLMFPNDRLFFWARIACCKFKEAFAERGHKQRFSVERMRFVLQDCGYEVESVERIPSRFFPLHTLIVARKP